MADGRASLRVLSRQDRRKTWDIEPDNTYLIGRSRSCQIKLADPTVSGRHARLEFADGVWFVIDLDSTHGTRVNRELIEGRRPLFDRDTIWVGKTLLEFREYEEIPPEDLQEMSRGVSFINEPSGPA